MNATAYSVSRFVLLLGIAMLSSLVVTPANGERTEQERIARYHELNHTWPPEKYVPETPGWRKLFEHRLRQVAEIEDRTDRFEGFAQTLHAAVVQKNFTEHGFGLARAPESLMEDLRRAIRSGVEKGPRLESYINAITEPRPWFIDRPDLEQRVLNELQHYPEAWVGFELTPATAYGFRLYRNTSRLHVHVDKAKTHVISFILHIDSSDDAEPWPILIEDFQGITHEVTLTSGDLLFYESSKCFHGRPRPFNGTWYSSVFVHYYPTHGYQETFDNLAKVDRIPPHWSDEPDTQYEIPVQMHGTTFEEPLCPNYWCNTKFSKHWSGPGEDGYVLNPDGTKTVLDLTQIGGPKEVLPAVIRGLNDDECTDNHPSCAQWASWKTNECESNPKFMKVNCPKSCGLCAPLSLGGDEL
mmetsp:Transcript_23566/g.55470  ORF Transcript_23566/g.55470 Transcript_23566/m.55470 type:complete len:412 (-) Transcript_23566:105-1340(-)|eukprot:CAMPEP_0172389166 /NCGR_PEP_ID=MMETSP1061-20121228/6134_1 /TAXON_ID=37318 /ORGANISM="Pseudo-nitzschia pungens, Strain cf. pungens" /LENGTH=411 /DNA_ID=CAMNT_0013119259 /DNA_START=343 /DNA_END=1578 /DNA_ORIENTATION=+